MTELTENQKEMISDLLIRTKTKLDMDINSEKILGNAYGDKKTVKAYQELAKLKLARIPS